MMGRPYLRSSLARALYDKMNTEEYINSYNKSMWYSCNMKLMEPDLCEKFLPLSYDEGSEDFVETCKMKSNQLMMHMWHSLAKMFLCWFMTQTSMNGLLNRGSMHVFSSNQFLELLGANADWEKDTLLDLGAGDGLVTSVMAPFFNKVYVTEASSVMRRVLLKKNYKVFDINGWKGKESPDTYDMITCLNLLDRCDEPVTLLKDVRSKLNPSGLLIVALVLPLSQFVEYKKNHQPKEILDISGKTFEEQVKFAVKVFQNSGFDLVKWTKLPYLCEGDMRQSLYWLSDAVFVLRRSPQ